MLGGETWGAAGPGTPTQDTPTVSPDSALLVQSASVRATPGTSRLFGHLLPDLALKF